MSAQISRFQLLRGHLDGAGAPLRPPHARPEAEFVESCQRTGACGRACPEKILVRGRGGFPEVDFRRGECTFCMDCVRACRSGALRADALIAQDTPAPWTVVATITGRCLSLRGVTCRSCGDVCEPRALRFRLAVGGRAEPEIDLAACTGCGACVAPCPVDAVRMEYRD
jgi:ferredoxin-type protein NapF